MSVDTEREWPLLDAAMEMRRAVLGSEYVNRAPCGWSRRLSSHPTAEERIRALQAATVDVGHPRWPGC
jgi:hypothetical protein